MSTVYDFEALQINGKSVALNQFKGKVMLIVNTASACGFTPQFAGLEALHESYGKKGLVVLGFPCNQFGAQEPGSDEEILEFAKSKYDCNFQLFSKVEVNGDGACDLYQLLKSEKANPDGKPDIGWNFTKFLIGKDGKVLARFEPMVTPEEIAEQLEELLA